MVHTMKILAKHEAVMILNDSFEQRTDFDSAYDKHEAVHPKHKSDSNRNLLTYLLGKNHGLYEKY